MELGENNYIIGRFDDDEREERARNARLVELFPSIGTYNFDLEDEKQEANKRNSPDEAPAPVINIIPFPDRSSGAEREWWQELAEELALALSAVMRIKTPELSVFSGVFSEAVESESSYVTSSDKSLLKPAIIRDIAQSVQNRADLTHAELEVLLKNVQTILSTFENRFAETVSSQVASVVALPTKDGLGLPEAIATAPIDDSVKLRIFDPKTEGLAKVESIAYSALSSIDDVMRIISTLMLRLSSSGDSISLMHEHRLREILRRLMFMNQRIKDVRVNAANTKSARATETAA